LFLFLFLLSSRAPHRRAPLFSTLPLAPALSAAAAYLPLLRAPPPQAFPAPSPTGPCSTRRRRRLPLLRTARERMGYICERRRTGWLCECRPRPPGMRGRDGLGAARRALMELEVSSRKGTGGGGGEHRRRKPLVNGGKEQKKKK
jgi:hypothetical protein